MTTQASESQVDYKTLEKKTVIFTVRNTEGGEVNVEGVVEAASVAGVAFRQKGKSQLQLLDVADILRHEIVPEKPKVLKQKVIRPVEPNKVRQHLADAHGLNLDWLNSVNNETAVDFHDNIDHVAEGVVLGHRHEEPKEEDDSASELEEALAE